MVAQTGAEGTRVQFETFDSSMDDRRDEKLVFKYINRGDERYLLDHLELVKEKVDLTKIYDRSGYSPLHFAAFKNFEKICHVLCDHVVNMDSNALEQGERKTSEALTQWINQASRGEEGFTALHFAAFHGNMKLIRFLVGLGANVYAKNKQEINMLHVAA